METGDLETHDFKLFQKIKISSTNSFMNEQLKYNNFIT